MFDRGILKNVCIALIITYGVVLVGEALRNPSNRQLLRMRILNGTRKFCQAQADGWSDLALRAGTAYQKARM